MESNYCWYNVNLDVSSAIKKGWTPPESTKEFYFWSNIIPFEEDWLKYLKSFGLEIGTSVLFYRNTYISDLKKEVAHIDLNYMVVDGKPMVYLCPPAINWCLSDSSSLATWYEAPEHKNIVRINNKFRNWGNPYVCAYPIKELKQIDQTIVSTTPVLYRVDVPHAIIHNGVKRWAVSLRLKHLPQNWLHCLHLFRKKKLLQVRSNGG